MSSLLSNETGPLGDQVERFLGQTASEVGQEGARLSQSRAVVLNSP